MDTRVDLDVIGVLENTDKSSSIRLSWDYLRHYEAMLEEFRHQPINVLEIGVAGGPSMRIWKWFFSRAHITGIDIDPTCVRHAQDRVTIEIGSQIDPDFLDRVTKANPPTVIVDDGSHIMEHMLYSFEHLFPKLLPGGVYIIEDFSGFLPGEPTPPAEPTEPQTVARRNAPRYFLDLAMLRFSNEAVATTQQIPPGIAAELDSITFIGQALLIRKKHVARDVNRAVATAENYLTDHRLGATARENLAGYIIRHGGAPDLAEKMLKAAIGSGGPTMSRLMLQARNLMEQRRTDEAAQALRRAADCPPQGHLILAQMARLQHDIGDIAGALKSASMASELRPKSRQYKKLIEHLKAAM